jgi:hypothetical protein
LFVGVFVGALAYELLARTDIAKKTGRKLSEGLQSAKRAFSEGYRSAAQPAPEGA